MSRIHILDQQTANSIAAGEVVERPASVVKELVENALDAAASVITVEIRQGGIRLIRVTDNGYGMSPEDALLAFSRHATSKLNLIEDLDEIKTMGFRGEALASIAAVAHVKLETREPDAKEGFALQIENGNLLDQSAVGCPVGTTISVEHLFANIPARFKFLRKDSTEAGVITDVTTRLALARPDISFRLINNGQEIIHTPGNNDLFSTIYALYGKKTAEACLEVNWQADALKIYGYAGKPELARSNRNQQSFFVNGRLVKSRLLTAALDEAYKTLLMKGKYAFVVLFAKLPPHLLDVNVHPQKLEVRFWNDQTVFRSVYHALRQTLTSGAAILQTDKDASRIEEEQQLNIRDKADSSALPDQEMTGQQEQSLRLADSFPRQQQELNLDPVPELTARPNNTGDLNPQNRAAREINPQPVKPNDRIDILRQARVIGQVFTTYILLEIDDDLLLIDQHAAHEKIIFEELVRNRQMQKGDLLREELLVPLRIEVTPQEMQFLEAETSLMSNLGFAYDRMGDREIVLRSQPATSFSSLLPEKAFQTALDGLLREEVHSGEAISELLYTIACKAAVKAHDRLQDSEISKLLAELQKLDNPYQCPHGRPVIIRISRRELEKKFKRIV